MVFAANAGFLSGFSGIESVPGPELPKIDFLSRWNGMLMNQELYPLFIKSIFNLRPWWVLWDFPEENQKKYAEADARFKESPLLKKLLEQSKLNKDKYILFPSFPAWAILLLLDMNCHTYKSSKFSIFFCPHSANWGRESGAFCCSGMAASWWASLDMTSWQTMYWNKQFTICCALTILF